MSASIVIPTPLRTFAGGMRQVAVNAETVGAALDELTAQYPTLRPQLFDGEHLRTFVNVFLNDENVRHLGGGSAAVARGDTITIVPSIAGG